MDVGNWAAITVAIPIPKTSMKLAYRPLLGLVLLVMIPLGVASKYYQGSFQWWVNDFSGDILYEIFWIGFIGLLFPHISTTQAAIGVFLATSFLEFLQLWHPPFLEAARSHLLGRLLLGTTFVWWDFPHYAIGCLLGWLGLHYLKRMYRGSRG